MAVVPFRRKRNYLATVLANLMTDSKVQIAGRDGSMSLAAPGCTFLDPPTGQAISANRAYNLVGQGGLTLPAWLGFPAATNLFLNATAPATQNCAVVTGSVTVTAIGTGYTVTTSAGTATGSGFGLVTNGTAQVLTITGNGSITLTIAGTPVNACVQVQAGALRTPLLVTDGSTKTRAADANVWTLPDALTQDEEIIVLSAQCYASGDMGVTNQAWLQGVTNPVMYRSAATALTAQHYNGTSAFQPTYTRTIPAKSVLFMQRQRFYPNLVFAGYGTSLGTGVATTATLTQSASVRIGHHATAGRESYALNACIRRKGGFSQAQIDALYYGFANGRTVPVVA
jgi:hypothetical protein